MGSELEWLRSIGEHLGSALCVLELAQPGDPGSLRLVYANRAAGEAWRAPVDALVDRRVLDAFPHLERTALPALWRDVVVRRRPATVEGFHYRGDSRIAEGVFSFTAFPVGAASVAIAFERIGHVSQTPRDLRHVAAIVESSFDAIIGKTLEGEITSWNPAAERIYGWSADEAIGQNIELIVPPDRREELQGILAALGRGERVVSLETARVRKDGKRVDVLLTISPITDERGTLIGASTIGRDLTLEQTARRQAREQEALFHAAFDSSNVAMALIDIDGHILRTNESLCRLLGYSRAELLERRTDELLLPTERESAVARRRAFAASDEQSTALTLHFVRRDRSIVPVRVDAARVLDAGGETGCLVVQIRDITAERRSQDELRRSEELYRVMIENTRDLVALVDLGNRFLFVSPAYERLLGYPSGELIGTHANDLVHPDDLARAEELALDPGEPTELPTLRVRRRDGTYVCVESNASVVSDGDGCPYGILAVSRDITERLRSAELEERLLQGQKMEAIGQLAGGIAHDFNNLLMAISGYANLARGGDDPATVRCHLDEVLSAADRAAQLTRQLLAFGRRQVLQAESLDLNEIVCNVQNLLARLIGEDIAIELDLADDLWPVHADAGQLGQVIINLAVNARDAMGIGGRLTFRTGNLELDGDTAREAQVAEGRYVELRVTDTGTGIGAEALAHVFEPFYTTKPVGSGTGLGLSTVFGIVKQSSGLVTVESTEGQGTTFVVALPASAQPVEGKAVQLVPSPERGGERILLVEDEQVVRELVSEFLERQGYRIEATSDPDDALASLARMPVDLLVTDVVMPKLSGRELAEAATRVQPGIKVMFVSGYPRESIDQRGVIAEGATFLQKPFGLVEIAQAVRAALDSDYATSPSRPNRELSST